LLVRADQKDAYYIGYLQDQIEPLIRAVKGKIFFAATARVNHNFCAISLHDAYPDRFDE
jgi:hypothetical protein